MKYTVLTSVLFLSAQAFACPNLVGKYDCEDSHGAKHSGSVEQSATELKIMEEGGGAQVFSLVKPTTEKTEIGDITLVPACTKDTILFTGTALGIIAKNTITKTAKGFTMVTSAGEETLLNATCTRK